jgi:hypothetical protein
LFYFNSRLPHHLLFFLAVFLWNQDKTTFFALIVVTCWRQGGTEINKEMVIARTSTSWWWKKHVWPKLDVFIPHKKQMAFLSSSMSRFFRAMFFFLKMETW